MIITVIGHGYVGLVSAAVFADFGNTVYVIGHTKEKIENLQKGILPIYEPGLEELAKRNVDLGRMSFTLDYSPAIGSSDVVFTTVGTPPLATGDADLSIVFQVAQEIGKHLEKYTVIVTKSTVPIGTNKKVKEIIEKAIHSTGSGEKATFDMASVPEFLREGQAISDTMKPDRVVIGSDSKKAQELLVTLHKPILEHNGGKVVLTSIETAEMIKYASNAFLATKISFANAIAQLSEIVGANGPDVLQAVGLDNRIGKAFLYAGAGYGGSCFPKDVKALIAIAKDHEYDFTLLKEVEDINKKAMEAVAKKATKLLGDIKDKTIGVLGLSFKPDTDDMRFAPSRVAIPELLIGGAHVKAYDPIAMDNAKKLPEFADLEFVDSAMEVAKDADLIILMTEWNEFKELDLQELKKTMKHPNIIDARNIYDPEKLKAAGFRYVGV